MRTRDSSPSHYWQRFCQYNLFDNYVRICKTLSWGCITATIVLGLIALMNRGAENPQIRLDPTFNGSIRSQSIENPNDPQLWNPTETSKEGKQLENTSSLWLKTHTKNCMDGCVVVLPNIRTNKALFWQEKSGLFVALDTEISADGIAVHVPHGAGTVQIVGKIRPETMYPVRVIQKTLAGEISQNRGSTKDKVGGLLYGALLSLAAFSAIVSILNRDMPFLILSAWLITTCRVAAFNGPWDFYWMGIDLSSNSQVFFSKIFLSLHTILSTALFMITLREHLNIIQTRIMVVVVAIGIATLPLTLLVPTTIFLTAFWITSAIALLITQFFAIQIAIRTKFLHIVLFNLAWGVILAGAICEMAFVSGYLTNKLSFLNVQSGAGGSGLIMAISIADKMRRERNARIATQTSLVTVFQKFKSLYANVPVGLVTLNSQLLIVEHNRVFKDLFGMRQIRSLKGQSLVTLLPNVIEQFKSNLGEGTFQNFECYATLENKPTWLRINAKKIGHTFDCSFENVTLRKLSEQKLEFLARHDALTGFKNRYEFDKILAATLEDKTKLSRTSVAHIDIKGFKLFNELFGYALGDEMLKQFADRIESTNKRGHQTFRLDGDDFYIIFADMDGPTVEFECSILQDALSRRHYVVNQRAMALEVGIGIVHLNDGISANDVSASASEASDRAKNSSDTKVVAVSRDSEDLKEQIQQRHLMASMKQRFPEERLFLNAQPIIALADPNGSLAYEVLVRLKGENGGVISPGQFIPAAEKNGLMSMVDRWVLNETLVWLELNKEHAKRVDFITVNLSGASLNDLRFAEDALAIIKEHRQLASKICFEVTESVALFDLKATLRFVEQTKSFGCKLALDDFGAGYTSFKYLKDIPSDILKIDGSYVRGINKSVANHAIVKAITDLTHEMGMMCVAEWIEDIPTIRTLQRLGMDYGQGFGMSRPMPMDDITAATSGFDAITEPAAIEFYSKLLHLPHRRMGQSLDQQVASTGEASREILVQTV
jgi:diguanylate cyclase (GGDEF)-like protein